MRNSKYVGKTFGNWICSHIGIASVSSKKANWAYHRTYYYLFERRTSDDLADKMVRLNASEAAKVYRGEITVEELVNIRAMKKNLATTREITYHFGE